MILKHNLIQSIAKTILKFVKARIKMIKHQENFPIKENETSMTQAQKTLEKAVAAHQR